MNQDQPVTRVELDNALTNLEGKLVGVVRDIETNLLTAFHSYARGNAARLSAMDVTEQGTPHPDGRVGKPHGRS